MLRRVFAAGRILGPTSRIRTGVAPFIKSTVALLPFSPYPSQRYATRHSAPSSNTKPIKEKIDGIRAELWLLENTASSEWLNVVPPFHELRLNRAYGFLHRIVTYIAHDIHMDHAEAGHFAIAFMNADVPRDSEIARGRRATATILRAVVRYISSIPSGSSLRTTNSELFNIFDPLKTLRDEHLMKGINKIGEVQNWKEFWTRAQPVVLKLASKLEQQGYGHFDPDELPVKQELDINIDEERRTHDVA